MKNRIRSRAQGHLTLIFSCQPPAAPSARARRFATIVPCLCAMLLAAGCATTKVTNREELVSGPLPRPGEIWVYDFAASAADVPADSVLAGQYSTAAAAAQTPQELAAGRKLGAEIASELVNEIRGMGLPAAQAGAATTPQVNDIVIRGYLVSIKEGSAAERIIIGFGAGASGLQTLVEGYQMTPQGLRKLGSGEVEAGGGKSPGAALGVVGLAATANPAGLIVSTGMKVYEQESGKSTVEGRAKSTAKEIADVLKTRFQEQGWIS